MRDVSLATLPRGSRAAAGPPRAGAVASRSGRAPRRIASHREGDRGDALLPRVAQGVVQHGDVRDGRQRAGEMRVFPRFAETRRPGFPGFAPRGVHPDGRARGKARAGLGGDGDHRRVGQLPGGGDVSHPPLRPRHETRVPVQTHLRHDPQPHARRGSASRGHARAQLRRVTRPEKRRRSKRRVGARRRRASSRGGTRRRGGGGGSRGMGGGDGARRACARVREAAADVRAAVLTSKGGQAAMVLAASYSSPEAEKNEEATHRETGWSRPRMAASEGEVSAAAWTSTARCFASSTFPAARVGAVPRRTRRRQRRTCYFFRVRRATRRRRRRRRRRRMPRRRRRRTRRNFSVRRRRSRRRRSRGRARAATTTTTCSASAGSARRAADGAEFSAGRQAAAGPGTSAGTIAWRVPCPPVFRGASPPADPITSSPRFPPNASSPSPTRGSPSNPPRCSPHPRARPVRSLFSALFHAPHPRRSPRRRRLARSPTFLARSRAARPRRSTRSAT